MIEEIRKMNEELQKVNGLFAEAGRVIDRAWEMMRADNARILGKRPAWWRLFARLAWNERKRYPHYLTPHLAHLWAACDELHVSNEVWKTVTDAHDRAHR